jgi:hypothetical protein
MYANKRMTFDEWMEKVDDLTYERFGVSYHELPDRLLTRSNYDDGCEPEDFVKYEVADLVQDEQRDMKWFMAAKEAYLKSK